jgi:hypothetical protein
MYPPVEPLIPPSSVLPDNMRAGILMIGRFFSGRSNKGAAKSHNIYILIRINELKFPGHDVAISVFKNLITSKRAPNGLVLTLVGALMPGHEKYLQNLKARNLDPEIMILTTYIEASGWPSCTVSG